MRKDGAKEFLQRPENRVQIVFLYQKLVHVSEICVNHSYARQILSKKAKRRRCVFACAVWSHVDGKVFLCQVKLQTTVNKCVFARYAVR